MKIAVPREAHILEPRVAVTPDAVARLLRQSDSISVHVEKDAGEECGFSDTAYADVGAVIEDGFAAVVRGARVVAKVRRPCIEEISLLDAGAIVLAQMNPFDAGSALDELARANVSAFALELIPRISRAQSMDILSSQANLAGYRAVIDAASAFCRVIPMMITAAGTVPAARIFVMGAGVAGLQAIATARRLGAITTATDVRLAAKEQVESLGAKFIAVENDEFREAETDAGYAKEMSSEYIAEQKALVAKHISNQDIVITTALIPGKPAPKLISSDMVRSMAPGSVIVDLAVERGGNCELAEPDKVIDHQGVQILGATNVPGRVATSASALYSRNLLAFLDNLVNWDDPEKDFNWDDEIIRKTCLTHNGARVHPDFGGVPQQDPGNI